MSRIRRLKFNWKFILYFGIFILFRNTYGVANVSADHLILIANSSVTVETLSSVEIKNMFTGKIKLYDNGKKIVLVYSKQRDTQIHFLKKYIKKTPQQFVNYWRNLIFIGKSSSIPKGISDETELMRYIASKEGAIGFISSQKLIDGVKIVSVE